MFVFVFLALVAFAEEPAESYQLSKKGWEAPVGMRLKVKSKREISNGKMKITADGSWTSGRITSIESNEIIGTRPDKDQYVLRFLSEQSQYRTFFNGTKSSDRHESPVHGKTVRFDREQGEWVGKVTKGDMDAVDPDELEERLDILSENLDFDYSQSLFGIQPRKIGETWKVDLPHIPGMIKAKVKAGDATITFEKLEELRGHRCAVLKVKFDVEMDYTKLEQGTFKYVGEATVVRSLEALLDFKFEATGKMKAVRESEGNTMETEGKCEMSSEIFILPPVEKE